MAGDFSFYIEMKYFINISIPWVVSIFPFTDLYFLILVS